MVTGMGGGLSTDTLTADHPRLQQQWQWHSTVASPDRGRPPRLRQGSGSGILRTTLTSTTQWQWHPMDEFDIDTVAVAPNGRLRHRQRSGSGIPSDDYPRGDGSEGAQSRDDSYFLSYSFITFADRFFHLFEFRCKPRTTSLDFGPSTSQHQHSRTSTHGPRRPGPTRIRASASQVRA